MNFPTKDALDEFLNALQLSIDMPIDSIGDEDEDDTRTITF